MLNAKNNQIDLYYNSTQITIIIFLYSSFPEYNLDRNKTRSDAK